MNIGTNENILRAIGILEAYANTGLQIIIKIDGREGIHCKLTGGVEGHGATILQAVEAAQDVYEMINKALKPPVEKA